MSQLDQRLVGAIFEISCSFEKHNEMLFELTFIQSLCSYVRGVNN